jgi:hypothetical protein
MNIDESTHVIVQAEDLSVTVNGLHSRCLTPDMLPKNMRTMTWRPGETPRGHFHGMPEGTHTFDEFVRFAPFIAAWRPHYEAWVKDQEAHKARLEANAKQNAEAEEKAKAAAELREKLKPLYEALGHLNSTDHHVIEAMEKLLAEQGKLPPDLVMRRQGLRSVVRSEKAKHGLK